MRPQRPLRPQRLLRPLELTFELEDFDFAEAEIFLLLPLISNVHKLARMTEAVVAEKNGLLGLEFAEKL